MARSSLPLGNIVKPLAHVDLPRQTDYEGEFITLSPVNPQADAEELYECAHGSDIKAQIWTYMSYGPFDSIYSMRQWLEARAKSNDPLCFTVHHRESNRRVGMVSFLNIAFRYATTGTRTYMVFARCSEVKRKHRVRISNALRGV